MSTWWKDAEKWSKEECERYGKSALKAIAAALDPATFEGLVEIVMLAESYFEPETWVMRAESALAINKTGFELVHLKIAMESDEEGRNMFEVELYTENWEGSLKKSAVYCLIKPEHTLAFIWRMRAIASCEVTLGPGLARFRRMVRLEKLFIDSILTSRLPRHIKSSQVWGYRRFLLRHFARFGLLDIHSDITKVVLVAGDRHPRNYYAWLHARALMNYMDWSQEAPKAQLLRSLVEWCIRHHDDCSGWAFLQSLFLTPGRYDDAAVSAVFLEVLRLAGLLHWTNESVWVFLRTLVASDRLREADYREFRETGKHLLESTKDETAQRILTAAADWASSYMVQGSEP